MRCGGGQVLPIVPDEQEPCGWWVLDLHEQNEALLFQGLEDPDSFGRNPQEENSISARASNGADLLLFSKPALSFHFL